MITRWKIWNFKSISSPIELDCKPLTILVGANSSGKSSIIQTLLLLKQSFQYGSTAHPVLLNGPLVRLGDFADVRHALSSSRSFGISFDLVVDPQTSKSATRVSGALDWATAPQIRDISCTFEVGRDKIESGSDPAYQPFLRKADLRVTRVQQERVSESHIAVRRARPDERQFSWERLRTKKVQLTDLRLVSMSKDLHEEIGKSRPLAKVHGVSARYFVPTSFIVSYDAKIKAAREAAEFLSSQNTFLTSAPSPNQSFLEAARAAVLRWLPERYASEEAIETIKGAENFNELGTGLGPILLKISPPRLSWQRSLLVRPSSTENAQLLQNLREAVSAEILSLPDESYSLDYAQPTALLWTERSLETFFKEKVRYLGPLRERPKALYPLQPLPDPTDVGYMGEHTAAVYDLNKNTVVSHLAPPRDDGLEPQPEDVILESAVSDWLSYMGVVQEVGTTDRGKFGRELQVRTPGLAKYHDLTNVGVGVSQVLPIVVMSLLAPKGSLLILEQPELHLHPKVQARLADFLQAMVGVGKQCIVETHSEYLIYRLRRRIAEAPEDSRVNRVSLYFVERERSSTEVRAVEINRFGSLSDWPKDFFDQSQAEAEFIVRAAARKHAAEGDRKK